MDLLLPLYLFDPHRLVLLTSLLFPLYLLDPTLTLESQDLEEFGDYTEKADTVGISRSLFLELVSDAYVSCVYTD